jgi:Integrase core domain
LTDHGTPCTALAHFRKGVDQHDDVQHPEGLSRMHAFDDACEQHGIEHRLTKPGHPWTNGQVERMNRTLKEATVKRYYYESHQQLKEHLYNFLKAYNFAKRLKTLHGLTPYEYIIKCWQKEPERFKTNPGHRTLGLNRRITRWEYEDVLERMQQRLANHPEMMLKRKAMVEHPFGTIKH